MAANRGTEGPRDPLTPRPARYGPPMDPDAARARNTVDPPPEPRFAFAGPAGPTLWFADYAAAVAFYSDVLGPPGYVEGEATRGWRIGTGWLTLLAGGDGHPENTEVGFEMSSPEEAERLHRALLAAGGIGPEPSDEVMYEPVRSCMVTDPFGTSLHVYARR